MNNMTVADRIKQRRCELELSQTDLARLAKYSDKTRISKIENSGNDISMKQIRRIAKALNVTPAYLMGWQESVTVSGHYSEVITVDLNSTPEPSKEEIDKALDLFRRFQNLPPEKQTALLTLLEVPRNDT